MSVYKLKINSYENKTKLVSVIRKFDSSLSIGEIGRRISENDYIVEYDMNAYDPVEDLQVADRIKVFNNLIRLLENCGARVGVYYKDELLSDDLFENYMNSLIEIEQEVLEDMDREAEE